jgi:hypothetical protein
MYHHGVIRKINEIIISCGNGEKLNNIEKCQCGVMA